MSADPPLMDKLQQSFTAYFENIVTMLPAFFGGILVFLLGWLLARVARRAAIYIIDYLNNFLERILTGKSRSMVRFSSAIKQLIAEVIFWLILFITTTIALQAIGFDSLATWLEKIVNLLPGIVTGSLILLLGYVLASMVKGLTYAAASSANLAEADLLSRLAKAVTLVTAVIIGLGQIGIDVSFITTVLAITLAALLLGFALAFGLGARDLVSNLIGAHYLRQTLEPGQQIRVGERQGRLLEVSSTSIILETEAGRVSIPARVCNEAELTILFAGTHHE